MVKNNNLNGKKFPWVKIKKTYWHFCRYYGNIKYILKAYYDLCGSKDFVHFIILYPIVDICNILWIVILITKNNKRLRQTQGYDQK